MKQLLAQHWFLLALLGVLLFGIVAAPWIQGIAEQQLLRSALVVTVLFVMALPVELRVMWRAIARPGPALLGVTVNLGLLPLFAWGVSHLLSEEMALGLLVAATTPSTLSSAAVWTRRAGGNDAVAILVTIITNSLCFVVTPLWLVVMTGRTIDNPELSFDQMATKLGLLVLLPMLSAQLLRMHSSVRSAAQYLAPTLNMVTLFGILSMVLFGAIGTGLRLRESSLQSVLVWEWLSMLAAVLLVHLTMLGAALLVAKWFGFSREDRIAVGFAGSQKTLMVGLLVAVSLQITVLPMVAYHICQLIADTVIADRYRLASRES